MYARTLPCPPITSLESSLKLDLTLKLGWKVEALSRELDQMTSRDPFQPKLLSDSS